MSSSSSKMTEYTINWHKQHRTYSKHYSTSKDEKAYYFSHQKSFLNITKSILNNRRTTVLHSEGWNKLNLHKVITDYPTYNNVQCHENLHITIFQCTMSNWLKEASITFLLAANRRHLPIAKCVIIWKVW